MAGWSDHMPAGMFLKSTAKDSNIGTPVPGHRIADFCREFGIEPYDLNGGERPIPIGEFIAYGKWFQQDLVPEVEHERLCGLTKTDNGYGVRLSSGEEFEASAIVLGCGVAAFANFPQSLESEEALALRAAGLLSHVADHQDLSRFAGERVAVIGAGQSALETSVLLYEQGAQVTLIARRPQLFWIDPPTQRPPSMWSKIRRPPAPLGAGWSHLVLTHYAGQFRRLPDAVRLELVRRVLGPAGSWWLHERFDTSIDVALQREVLRVAADGEQVKLSLGLPNIAETTEELKVDRVIAATGYRVNLERLSFLDPTLGAKIVTISGSPRLSALSESSVPGLFFAGLASAATFGPMMRFVAGSNFSAQRIASGVKRRVRART